MAGIRVSSSTQFRNQFGQYQRVLDRAAVETVRDTSQDLGRMAKANAPIRTGELRASIWAIPEGKRARVVATADHAAPIETGASPHFIPGGLGRDPGVNHPGNRPYRYLRRAIQAIMPKFLANAERHYPG
jgi:hypothetical protein